MKNESVFKQIIINSAKQNNLPIENAGNKNSLDILNEITLNRFYQLFTGIPKSISKKYLSTENTLIKDISSIEIQNSLQNLAKRQLIKQAKKFNIEFDAKSSNINDYINLNKKLTILNLANQYNIKFDLNNINYIDLDKQITDWENLLSYAEDFGINWDESNYDVNLLIETIIKEYEKLEDEQKDEHELSYGHWIRDLKSSYYASLGVK